MDRYQSVIITKDEDFVLLRAVDAAGPSVVWIRMGNALRRTLLDKLSVAWPAVIAQLEAGEPVVEIR